MIKMLSGNNFFFQISAVRTGVCAYMDATLLSQRYLVMFLLCLEKRAIYVHQASQDRITDVSSNLCIMRIEAGNATYQLTYQVI